MENDRGGVTGDQGRGMQTLPVFPMRSASLLECERQLGQSIHNLKMRWPIGIRSVDDSHDEKLKRLQKLKVELYENIHETSFNNRCRNQKPLS